MTDYSELVNALRSHTGWTWHKTLLDAAEAIEELSKRLDESIPKGDAEIIIAELAKPRWIPVTERLPDVYKHVLVNIPGMSPHPTVQEAFYEKSGMWYSNGFRYNTDENTHWMPLPEPPKEET